MSSEKIDKRLTIARSRKKKWRTEKTESIVDFCWKASYRSASTFSVIMWYRVSQNDVHQRLSCSKRASGKTMCASHVNKQCTRKIVQEVAIGKFSRGTNYTRSMFCLIQQCELGSILWNGNKRRKKIRQRICKLSQVHLGSKGFGNIVDFIMCGCVPCWLEELCCTGSIPMGIPAIPIGKFPVYVLIEL